MIRDTAENPDSPPRPRRLRFSLWTMLVVVTIACVIFGLMYRSHGAAAVILFQVRAQPTVVGNEGGQFDAREFEIFQQSQISRIKSDWLLQSALRDPSLRRAAILAERGDLIVWLRERLEVEFPQQGEILSIQIRGARDEAADLRLIVDAVAKAYREDVLESDRIYHLKERDTQARLVSDLRERVENRIRQIDKLKEELGETDAAVKTAQLELEINTSQWRVAIKKLELLDARRNAPPRVQMLYQNALVREW
jgi:hypothetical protein